MHQFKINGKMAFDGDVWQWHQDYGTWLNDDLMPTERAMNVAIFLDDVNEFNGPLMFIPGSHKQGVVDAKHDTHDDELSAVDRRPRADRAAGRARAAASRAASSSPTGPAGSMILFHSLPGACLEQQPVAVEPRQRVPEPVRGQQPHPPLQAARVHRAPRLHADRVPARRLPAEATTRSTCRGKTACRRARCETLERADRPNRQAARAGGSMSLYAKLQQRARRRQADARRPHRRRQVRLDVPRAGAAHSGRAPGRHRRPLAAMRRAPTSRASAGAAERTQAASLDEAVKTGTTHDRATTGARWCATRRSTSSSNAPGTRSPRSTIASKRSPAASTWSTSRSRPMPSAARCWRARRPKRAWSYSLAFGDQPALICDLVDWARTCGFRWWRPGAATSGCRTSANRRPRPCGATTA